MRLADALRRHEGKLTLGSLAVGLLALLVLWRALPLPRLTAALLEQTQAQGPAGLLVFAAVYAAATVLMVPGSVLTLAAGAAYGPLRGLIAVSLGSTGGAALAFLIGRHLARERVAGLARRRARFAALDRAIADGGWKVVALLRLSPVIPFNLQNYLYGLTALRFWPCVLTSWLAMLPGTFLYVYAGYVAGAAVRQRARSPAEWALLAVGLLATGALALVLARLARRRLKLQTGLLAEEQPMAEPEETEQTPESPPRSGLPWGALGLTLGALLLAALAALATLLPGLFGPPRAELHEAYAGEQARTRFDHSAFTALLRAHVSAEGGWVDYAGLAQDAPALDRYLESLATAPFDELGRDGKLAFLLNAYNAATLRLILDHLPLDSIKDIPADERWDARRWTIAGHTWSLNQIEHEQIRPRFAEPRVHFALVCAAVGCPPLRSEAYTAEDLERQLDDQARYVHEHATWFAFDRGAGVARLTRLYDWYGGDFEQAAGSVLDFAARYAPDLRAALDAGQTPRIEWLDYDWRLNDRVNRVPR